MQNPIPATELSKSGVFDLLHTLRSVCPHATRFVDLTPGRGNLARYVSTAAITAFPGLEVFIVAEDPDFVSSGHGNRLLKTDFPTAHSSLKRCSARNGAIRAVLIPEAVSVVYMCTRSMTEERYATVMEILRGCHWALLVIAEDGPWPDTHLSVTRVHMMYAQARMSSFLPTRITFWQVAPPTPCDFDAIWANRPIDIINVGGTICPSDAEERARITAFLAEEPLFVDFLGPDARPPSPPDWPELYNPCLPEIKI